MVVNPDKKFIFVHIPKVAGSSITQALGSNPKIWLAANDRQEHLMVGTHTYASEIKRFLGENMYAHYYKFAFVRNPWDRLYSYYKFMTRSPEINRAKQWFDQEEAERRGFKWFLLENRLKTTRVKMYGVNLDICQQVTPQVDWIMQDDKLIVNFVGTYENIQQDFEVLRDAIKMDIELPWVNRQEDKSYTEMYDNEMIEFVEKYHKKDIDFFGYTFD